MKYDVIFSIDARCCIAVEAESPEDARHKAATELDDADLNTCEYIDAHPVMVEDSTGDIVWEA